MATSTSPAAAKVASARGAYEDLAPFYDDFTADYAHEPWLAELERCAARWGVQGGKAFDVGCGTGASAWPLQRRGWQVTACDLSPAMVSRARERLGLAPDRCFVADMRALPRLGRFDLILSLDDAVNYLTEPGDLAAALASMRALLAPEGVVLFDVNSLLTYETVFTASFARPGLLAQYRWRGLSSSPACADEEYGAELEVRRGGTVVGRSIHRQRHYSRRTIAAAAQGAGLSVMEVLGQSAGGRLGPEPDERQHLKLVYVLQASRGR